MTEKNLVAALVLGAGRGTRMKSDLPKVLLQILDQPMLFYSLTAIKNSGIDNSAVVTGHKGEMVQEYLLEYWPETVSLNQDQQLGTGHAVKISSEWWMRSSNILVLPGDVPFISSITLKKLIELHLEEQNDCTFLTFEPEDPSGYGRVVETGPHMSIVEEKDASDLQKEIREVNSGIYIFKTCVLDEHISSMSPSNAQNEYYLTDLVSILSVAGKKVCAYHADDPMELTGINDPVQLSDATTMMKDHILGQHMLAGVKIMDMSSTFIGPAAVLENDVFIEPFVQVWGSSRIGKGSRIGSHSTITDSILYEKVHLVSHVVVNNSTIGDNAVLGPFAFVRDNATIASEAFIGKFVEIKKSDIGQGSKVPHLSYIGDATIGCDTNIGAGTITCNYDGQTKHRTIIGSDSFVGSDTILVAPVILEDDTFTAAGSVITHDVPSGALAVSRSKQRNIEGWAKRRDRSNKRRK